MLLHRREYGVGATPGSGLTVPITLANEELEACSKRPGT